MAGNQQLHVIPGRANGPARSAARWCEPGIQRQGSGFRVCATRGASRNDDDGCVYAYFGCSFSAAELMQ
jgi:hypothetical protein